ncbi:MAG: helix-turn-helix domain-containing protein [Prevotella sp.]|nr:helix-turn-helix domain-containing protein [Prevotella sp.]MCM1074215.1 helix-turn-helix domain-containing protein [Ruminococcus sp.]
MIIPNPNVSITLRDLADYIKTSTRQDVLAFDTFTPRDEMPKYPLRIDALTILLCTRGESTVVIDLTEYHLKENTLLVLQPENFLQVTRCSEDFSSNVVVCSKEVVSQILPKMSAMLPLIIQHRTMPTQQLTEKEAIGIKSFYTFLKLKLEEEKTPFQEQKVLCLLQAALFEIMDIRMMHSQTMPAQHTRKEEIMARFILEVCKHFQTERQVSFYAKNLCVTPKHLSSVVKEISGRTAGDWIDHYVVMEAKMLLGSTDMTVQEISSKLNFANQSFFGKYFKHHTGIPPTEFRLKNNIASPHRDEPEIL